GLQGHLSVCLRAGPEGLHDVPLQSGSFPGRAGQRRGSQEHDLRVHARRRLLREVLNMSTKIDKRIVKYRVEKPADKAQEKAAAAEAPRKESNVVWMHEKVERPEMLLGSTYKIKTPVSDHAMYVTINDIVLNEGTPHEQRRPFEIFINSKNLDHFQW